jgi:hypothetical protein
MQVRARATIRNRSHEKIAACSISRAHDCRFKFACTSETQKMYGHAHGPHSLRSHSMQQGSFVCDIEVLRK